MGSVPAVLTASQSASLYEQFHGDLLVVSGGVAVVLVLGGWLATGRRRSWRLAVLVGPIAVVMVQQRVVTFVARLVLVGVVLAEVGIWMVSRGSERRVDSGWLAHCDPLPVGPMWLVSLIGVWMAVPDTEPALIAGATIAAVVVVGADLKPTHVDRLAAIALVVFSAWAGSAGRAELIGGLGCVGLLGFRWPSWWAKSEWSTAGLIAVHAVICVVFSRAVTSFGWWPAIAVLAALVVAGLVSWVVPRPQLSQHRAP